MILISLAFILFLVNTVLTVGLFRKNGYSPFYLIQLSFGAFPLLILIMMYLGA